MKTAGLMALLIALATPLAAESPPVRHELEAEFQYRPTPATAAAAGALAIAEQKVEQLEAVIVTAPGRSRQLDADIRLRAQALRETKFTLLNGGGTLFERKGRKVTTEVQLKLVTVWEGAGVDVLRISW